jgi:N-acetylglutamate synthase/N-acetylornithine aminotransferase
MEAPLIDVPDGTITTPRGFLAGATAAGIRDDVAGKLDLALLVAEERQLPGPKCTCLANGSLWASLM